MIIIEPHIHMYSRTTDDYQAMYKAGIRACVEPILQEILRERDLLDHEGTPDVAP